jgi:trehalose 6-phosphate synthase
MRFLTCSYGGPRRDGDSLVPRAGCGLVPVLIALLTQHGGHWICAPPPGVPTAGATRLDGDIWLHPVQMPEEIRRRHHDTICTGLLLGVLHYLHDTSREPVFDHGMQRAWAAYEAVNRMYAGRLARLSENSADEWILINGPQLMMVPALLAGEIPARRSRLTYFLGTPWCAPDYFSILPAGIRVAILNSLLRCDVVGFQAGRWADAFLACCARFLPGATVRDRTVSYAGRAVQVVAAPFPVEADLLERMRGEPATRRWAGRLAGLARGRRVLVRADRLDPWNNAPRGFASYEAMLRRRPALAEECWFGAVVTMPDRPSARHHAHSELTESAARRINERFGTPGREAVSLIYPGSGGDSRNCVVAALGMADAALVNPTYDGLSLFAKEAALLMADHASLLLSANAGAHEQLGPYAITVDPFDLDQTSLAMEIALDGAGDGPDSRAPARRQLLRLESPARWLEAVFADAPVHSQVLLSPEAEGHATCMTPSARRS